jgi:hypothetical protein
LRIAGAAPLRERPGIVVAYRTGGAWSALLIEPSRQEATKRIERSNRDGLAIYQWRGRDQRYTLVTAGSDASDRGCGLCHHEVPAGTV